MTKRLLFNDRLKYIGCTMKELSERADIHPSTIMKYARDFASVCPFVQERIEKAMDDLFKEKLYDGGDF